MIKNFAEAQEILAASLPGYTRRPHQMGLAAQVEKAIADRKTILANAGCGTGKSLGGLIPLIIEWARTHELAMASPDPEAHGSRAVVATATKALQEQYKLDLLFLQQHLGIPFKWAVIKGRSNYPCQLKMSQLENPTYAQARVMKIVGENTICIVCKHAQGCGCTHKCDYAYQGEVVDRETLPATNEREWQGLVTSATDCPGRKHCPFGRSCLAETAKATAADSAIVVTNVSYLLQDLLLRGSTEGAVALLGDYEHVLVDEAHELGDKATDALSDSIGARAFEFLSRDVEAFLAENKRDYAVADKINLAAYELWGKLDAIFQEANKDNRKKDPVRLTLSELLGLGDEIMGLIDLINEATRRVTAVEIEKEIEDARGWLQINPKWLARYRLLRRTADWANRLGAILTSQTLVRWLEMEIVPDKRSGMNEERLMLCSAPLSPAEFLQEALFGPTQTTLMSATLAVGRNGFRYVRNELGISNGMEFDAGTPFNFATQAKLFVPAKGQPEPAGGTIPAWRVSSQQQTRMLVEAADGNALLLFTSNENMRAAWDALAPGFRQLGLTVLKQGDGPAPELIAQLKKGKTVLFGLKTFFVGVDVQGEACKLVVIDKLPFTPPTDVLYKARCEAIVAAKGNWADFRELAIPSMSLLLIQGVGRLIRHAGDQGVMAVLDPRLKSKSYGTTILNSLPDAPVTTDIREAMAFLREA